MSIAIRRNESPSASSTEACTATYKVEMHMSKTQPYLLRTNANRNPIVYPIYFSLIGLRCESPQGYDEGVDFIDPWHRYVDEPTGILGESTVNADANVSLTNSNADETSAATVLLNTTTPSRNQYQISSHPENEFGRLLGGVADNGKSIEWITPETLSTRDSIQVILMLALDPHLFKKKTKKRSTITVRRRGNLHSNAEHEEQESSSSDATSSGDGDEVTNEADLEIEEEPDVGSGSNPDENDDDDEAIYILAENFRVNQEAVAEENESNASTEPATSSEPEI